MCITSVFITEYIENSGDTILIFYSSFNIKLNMTPQNSKAASEFSKVSPEYESLLGLLIVSPLPPRPQGVSCKKDIYLLTNRQISHIVFKRRS